jgi:4-amino-4-deoxy-L-arabinose transferase-like glycosyltransferase
MDSTGMLRSDCKPRVRPVSLSLILYSLADHFPPDPAAQKASDILKSIPCDYEILVIGNSIPEQSDSIPAPTGKPSSIRFLESANRSQFASILRCGLTSARNSLLVFADPDTDLNGLNFILPLAERVPIVTGYRSSGTDSPWQSLRSRVVQWTAHLLLGTKVRDLESGLLVLRRADLEPLLPNSEGRFASAEFFARARQHELEVVEIPVQGDSSPACKLPLGWRDFYDTLADCLKFWWSRVQFPGAHSPSTSGKSWSLGLMVLAFAALLLFANLNQQPLLDPIEGRQAEIPREMLAHHDLIVPRLRGMPYYEKPPLQYWLTMVSYTWFGVHPWSARLVPAVAAWFSVLVTYLWSRQALGIRPAFLGCLVLCLTWGFNFLGRTVLLDSLLASCVVAAWFTAYLGVCRSTLRWSWWLVSALFCGLGILAKGPVSLALWGPPVLAFQFLTMTAARPRWIPWLLYGGVALAVATPWYVIMALREPPYLEQFLWRSNIVRFVSPFDHEQDWWFYFPVLFALVFPWSLLWLALAYFLGRKKASFAALRTPSLGFCTLAVVWGFLFFSVSGSKSPPYLTPIYVPLALLVGGFLDAVLFRGVGAGESFINLVQSILPRWATLLVLWTSAISFLVTGALDWQEWGPVLIKTGLILAAMIGCWRYARRASPQVTWGILMVATLPLVGSAIPDLALGYASRHSPREVTELVGHYAEGTDCPVISFDRDWMSASVYLHRDGVPNFDKGNRDDMVLFLHQYSQVLVLVEKDLLEELLTFLRKSFDAAEHYPANNPKVALVVVRNRQPSPQQ